MTVNVVICYDVKTSDDGGSKRLRRIAEACKDFGVRVQYSVFECSIGEKDWVMLQHRLLEEYDEKHDSLRFYFMDAGDFARREHHGVREPLDPKGTLFI
jgi:CRISPR-associated protein Cas2